jgi:hypothetical protein
MTARIALGGALALASLWPVWQGLRAVAGEDYLAGLVALALAWTLARMAVELARAPAEEERER